jgi:hypothetical protein
MPFSASAASLYLDPDQGTYGPGDTFIVNVRLNTDGECINAADITLTYPTESLRAVDFGKGGSIFTLWVTEPKLDTEKGAVAFAGGVPGGYCGRIQGDPSLTNTIAKIVFTVTQTTAPNAKIAISGMSALYLNDGLGTRINPETSDTTIRIAGEATQSENPWLTLVGNDKIPPESFDVLIESTRSLFGGEHYAAFSTVDKQSGVDHYEMVINGTWQRVTSPRVIDERALSGGIEVRAIDKAGNVRLGTYVGGSVPSSSFDDYLVLLIILVLLACALLARHYLNKRNAASQTTIDLRS